MTLWKKHWYLINQVISMFQNGQFGFLDEKGILQQKEILHARESLIHKLRNLAHKKFH